MQLALEAVREGRDALYLSTENTPSTIMEHAQGVGLLLPGDTRCPKIQFADAYSWRIGMRRDPLAISVVSNPGNLNEVNLILTDHAKTLAPGSIVVIDSVSGLSLTTPEEDRIRTFVHILAQRLAGLGRRVVFVLEQEAHESKLIANLRSLVHGTIYTKSSESGDDRLHWFLRMYSLVGANFRTEWFELALSDQGLQLVGGAKHE
jgi:KaiC/GvpD/RAD55 family RecA-like ATPase